MCMNREGQSAPAWMAMMCAFEGVILMGHQLPDHDAVGGMAGMAALAAEAGVPVFIAAGMPGEGLQEAVDNLAADGMPVIESPPDNIGHCVIVVADTQRSTFAAYPDWLPLAGGVAVIDHHLPGVEPIPAPLLTWLDPQASSTSELVACLLSDAAIKPTVAQAELMLAGITLDTHRFLSRVSARTFRSAAQLCEWGAQVGRVRAFFEDKVESFIARSQVIHDAEIEDGIAYSAISIDVDGGRVVAAQAADELVFLQGIRGALVACMDGGVTAVSARAREGLSAVEWVAPLGGGGTHVAAGLQLSGVTPCEAIARIRALIKA